MGFSTQPPKRAKQIAGGSLQQPREGTRKIKLLLEGPPFRCHVSGREWVRRRLRVPMYHQVQGVVLFFSKTVCFPLVLSMVSLKKMDPWKEWKCKVPVEMCPVDLEVMATICWFLRLPYFSERSSILDYTLSAARRSNSDLAE